MLAEDVVQEVFVQIWEKRNKIDTKKSIEGLLYVMVRNKCIDKIASNKKESELKENILSNIYNKFNFKNNLIEQETYRLLNKAIDLLPEQTKKIILFSINGLKNNHIADELDISVTTVKYHKSKALSILRDKLKHCVILILFLTFTLVLKKYL